MMEEFFKTIISKLTPGTHQDFPDSVLYGISGDVCMEHNKKEDVLYCLSEVIWSFFTEKLGMSDEQTSSTIKEMMEKHLGDTTGTPKKVKENPWPFIDRMSILNIENY
jgi:hypothetical protein